MGVQGRARRSLETQIAGQTLCQQSLVVLASLHGLGQVPVLCLMPSPVFGVCVLGGWEKGREAPPSAHTS